MMPPCAASTLQFRCFLLPLAGSERGRAGALRCLLRTVSTVSTWSRCGTLRLVPEGGTRWLRPRKQMPQNKMPVSIRRVPRYELFQAASAVFDLQQFQGSRSSRRVTGCSAMRARTSASQACGSTLLSLAVPISEYMTAARWPPRSEPQKSHDLRPRVTPRRARSAALLVMQTRPSSRNRVNCSATIWVRSARRSG